MTALSPTRALRKPRRLDLRAVLGIVLTLLAIFGSVAYWTLTSDAGAVVIARGDLLVNSTLCHQYVRE